MKKLLSLSLILMLLVGCAVKAPTDTFFTFTDHTGTQVHLAQKPQTAAVLFSSYAEIWTLAGGRVAITVGESVQRGFAEESAILVDGGAGKTIDLERLIAAKPDLVIGSADIPAQAAACQNLRDLGIPAALFRVDTFQEYLQVLKICTQITENPEAYKRHGTQVEEQIHSLLKQIQGLKSQRVLFIRTGSSISSTKAKRAPENFVCTMLQELGAHNIADDAPILLDGLSLETVLMQNPGHIFISTMGSEEAAKAHIADLFSQNGWSSLDAVQNGHYTFLPRELFHFKPNARWADAYHYLAQILYPELDLHE